MQARLSVLLAALGVALCSFGQACAQATLEAPIPQTTAAPSAPQPASTPGEDLDQRQRSVDSPRVQQQAVLTAAAQDDKLKQQVDLLQKQIKVQQKLIVLLMEQMKKGGASVPAMEKLQTEMATLEARSKRAAQRDQELAHAIDKVVEHQDAVDRFGPALPAPLKELFLPSGNNETALSIYGALSFGFSKIIGNSTTAANGAGRPSTPGGVYFGGFTPDFLIKLNDWIFLESEIGVGGVGSVAVR